MFEFQFELNREDYYAYNQYHTHHAPASKRMMRRSRLILPLYCLAAAVYFAVAYSALVWCVVFLALGLLWLFCHDALTDWRIKRNINRYEKDGKLNEEGPYTYCFEEDSFISTTKTSTIKSTYGDFERVDVGEQAVYLYVAAVKAHIFPNRVFADEEEKESFVGFVRGKISEGKEESKAV